MNPPVHCSSIFRNRHLILRLGPLDFTKLIKILGNVGKTMAFYKEDELYGYKHDGKTKRVVDDAKKATYRKEVTDRLKYFDESTFSKKIKLMDVLRLEHHWRHLSNLIQWSSRWKHGLPAKDGTTKSYGHILKEVVSSMVTDGSTASNMAEEILMGMQRVHYTRHKQSQKGNKRTHVETKWISVLGSFTDLSGQAST